MFHDDRIWCVRPEGTPEAVAMKVTRRTWPTCTAFEAGGYLFLNDSLPEDGSTDYAVVKRPTEPGGRFVQVASLTLGFWSYENALDLIRSVLAGDYDAPVSTFAVDPHLEPAPALRPALPVLFLTPFHTQRIRSMTTTKQDPKKAQADKAKPVHEVRLGRIRAAVWLNETDNGPRYNVQISRLYKDKADKWKDSSSFGREDLPLVGKVADLAMVWIYENPAAAEK